MKRYAIMALVALFAVAGLATAQAAKKPPKSIKVAICHRTSSATNPYVRIVVRDRATLSGHMRHPGDLIPAPAGGCPRTVMAPDHGGVVFTTTLTGANEVPGPGDPDGTGTATIRMERGGGMICFSLAASNITLPATAAHIHAAPKGVAGAVVVPLTAPDASGKSHGCVAVDRTLVSAILDHPSEYYVNVHTSDFPAGAIRGQLG